MNCPKCETPMQLFAGNRERHWVCPKCNTCEDRTPKDTAEVCAAILAFPIAII